MISQLSRSLKNLSLKIKTTEIHSLLRDHQNSAEIVYLVALVFFICSIFPDNAAARIDFFIHGHLIQGERILRHIGSILALMYYVFTWKSHAPIYNALFAFCLVISRLCLHASGDPIFFWCVLLVFCADKVSFRKIVKTYLFSVVVLMLVYYTLGLLGIIPFFDYYTVHGMRHSFGSVYPTDFAAHIFYIALATTFLRREKLNMFDIIFNLGCAWFCMTQCIARSATFCLILLAMVCTYIIIKQKKRDGYFYLSRLGFASLIAISLFCLVFTLYASYCYDSGNPLFSKINTLLSNRLTLGHQAFETLLVTPFGQHFRMVGFGGHTNAASQGGYFYLDSWYMQALMRWGISCIALCLLACIFIHFKAYREKCYLIPLLLTLICIHCITDQYLTNYCYNFLMFALTADLEHTEAS